MESENKGSKIMGGNGMDGVENRGGQVGKQQGRGRSGSCVLLVVRVLGLVFTLVAAILLGVDKQTKVVPIQLLPTLPRLDVPVTARWHHSSAFVYFEVANIMACSYASLSLVLIVTSGGASHILKSMIIILDAVMVALLFSGIGAAAAVGLIGYQGNSHLQWGKVCNVFGKFCNQGVAAAAFSLLGSLAFLLIVVFSALRAQGKS
ncbi:CASP-like protein 1E2 [Corylus avellana]|uniref:CASP-like protein 1E2 n=1 Tax=Corylus avellana TaxID=13451 RepID=UPI00286AB516|nr:CASP-like protein 1E2 [Corylus avellana]